MSVTQEPLHRTLGLKDDELERIRDTLGRDPRPAELAMYGAMWSEHCSYKSSKIHLTTLPTEGPAVLVGPGQDGKGGNAKSQRLQRDGSRRLKLNFRHRMHHYC